MRILITGGGGYLGAVLAPLLLEEGHAVTVLDTFGHRENSLAACCAMPGFDAVKGDARDERVLRPLVAEADAVVALAAVVGAPACERDIVGAQTTNAGAIETLVRLISPLQLLVFPNTNSGYGTTGAEAVTEEAPLRPISWYGETKLKGESTALSHGAEATVFRFATLFGASPRMRTDLLVNDFVHRAVADRALVLYEGGHRRNYLHVRDAARLVAWAVDGRLRGVFNAGDPGANLTKRELCAAIAAEVPDFAWIEAPAGRDPDQRDYLVSNDRLVAAGWSPRFSLADGVRELARLYRTISPRRYANA